LIVFLIIPATLVVKIEAQDEITSPVCRQIKRNSLSFCSMVDYMAVVDEKDLNGQKANEKAQTYYDNMNILLLRFSCSAKYSLYTCDDCRDAYKYWICSAMFQKCGDSPKGPTATLCAPETYCKEIKDPPLNSKCCDESIDGKGRKKTCLSLCEDVIRKCPYVLNFQCPSVS
jgi:calcium channel MID1